MAAALRSAPLLALVASLAATLAAPLASSASAQARPRDTLPDSVRAILRDVSREARQVGRSVWDSARRPVTVSETQLASAFADPEAREILLRARAARLRQDSALRSYRATTTQRISLGMGVRRLGLEKTLFRGDNVSRIDWSRDGGVWVTPIGSRMQVPMAGGGADGDFVDAVSIPYFPGKETLWLPSSNFGVVKADVDDREIIHPIANGAEAYYRYATGDSITITLGGGRQIRLRELRITARRPQWRLFVGSFWFDRDGGQLARAAYRLAVPIEFWDLASEEIASEMVRDSAVDRVRDSLARERLSRADYVTDSTRRARAAASNSDDDEPPGWVKAAFRPARGSLDAVTVEYGLYGNGRFWLPRANSATFSAQVGPLRTPFTFDEKFTYEDVNGDFTTPPVPPERTAVEVEAERAARRDSTRADSAARAEAGVVERDAAVSVNVSIGTGDDSTRLARADSAYRARNCRPGDSTYVRTESRYNGALRVAYTMPCDRASLRTSSALPPANMSTEELFDLSQRDDLIAALGLSLQPAWGPQAPTVRTGLDLIRYNRVEGLSVGLQGEQVLGAGYTARASVRLGHADQQLNGELGFERANGRRTVYGTVYERLRATAPEWGNPLSFGPSVPALLYARDEGFYFRTRGVEVGDRQVRRTGAFEWRLYHEQQRTAGDSSVVDTWSLGRVFGNRFRTNFDASRVSLTGLDVSWSRAFGADPAGLRLVTAVRGEGATGTVTFGRAAFEATASRPLRKVALALTASAGSSVGDVPPQRNWFLGGLRTVRGSTPGSEVGNAYWFLRQEVGTKFGAVRPVVFFDAGWAGARDAFGEGRVLRGAGGGLSFLDGIFRLDIARNLARGGGWRTDLYFEAPI
jgi:hypothetical protein